ncbi:F0F1 ATP synthase subunit B [Aerococcaceae bacterium WGS1372]
MLELITQTGLGHFIMTVISFIILLFLVYKFAWDPISKILDEREALIDKNIKEAKEANKEAKQVNEEARQALVNARADANKLVQDTKWQISKMKTENIEKTNQEIEEMRNQAEESLVRERRHMLESMEDQIGQLSVEIAKQILRREVNSNDHKQLISDFILEMDANIDENR